MRLPRPTVARPAAPSGRLASFAVRLSALRGRSDTLPFCPVAQARVLRGATCRPAASSYQPRSGTTKAVPRKRNVPGTAVTTWCASGLAEDPVQVRTALGALGLSHACALVVDLDLAVGGALGLALDAVELAAPGLCHEGPLLARYQPGLSSPWPSWMLAADRPAVGRSAQSGFTLRQAGRRSRAARHVVGPSGGLREHETGSRWPPTEPLAFPCERPLRRIGSLLEPTLG